MKQIELVKSPVQFIEDREQGIHKYYLGFSELSGVTAILNAVIFRDKYAGIGVHVLNKAAQRGTAIHEAIQAYVMCKTFELSDDLQPFIADAMEAREAWTADVSRAMKQGVAVEYLVSDCKEIATKIDVVEPSDDVEGGVDISDIKTTYQLDEDYLAWQLSVEKYLFERQNPGLKVRRLFAWWWNRQRKAWEIRELAYKGDDEVERLFAAWRAGEFWGLPNKDEKQLPAAIVSIANVYTELERECKTAEARRDEFRTRLMDAMNDYGIKSFKAAGITVSYIAPSTSGSLDKTGLLADHPELKEVLSKYTKTTQKGESIRITLKDNSNE